VLEHFLEFVRQNPGFSIFATVAHTMAFCWAVAIFINRGRR